MASAALERLLHRATIIYIKGQSHRLKDKRKAGLFPSLQHKPERPQKKRLKNPAGGFWSSLNAFCAHPTQRNRRVAFGLL
jgi:hypothetical protein